MDKVSVIIPTCNRFRFLLHNLQFIKNNGYNNLEIIVVNDCSSEKEYYEYDWEKEGVIIIHLEEGSKKKFGYGCVGYVRNVGIERASGKYVAFCDDDDTWIPNKIELQVNAMKVTGCKISSTDGYFGRGLYNPEKLYKKYNNELYYEIIKNIYNSKGSNLLDNGFPKIWTLDFSKIHNCIICSSVIVEKELLNQCNNMPFTRRGQDWECWLNILKHTNSVYVNKHLVYYDGNHGKGQNH